MSQIGFVYFDLGNVLCLFDHRRACHNMAELCGLSAEDIWKQVFGAELLLEYECGQLTRQQFYDNVCQTLQVQPDMDALEHAASDIFTPNVPVLPVVTHLRAAGIPLGILSNTNVSHWDHLVERCSWLKDYFGVTALSFELQHMKPAPAIYEAATDLAGVSPEEIFFVDDRMENVQGAREAGWRAECFHDHLQLARQLRDLGLRFNY